MFPPAESWGLVMERTPCRILRFLVLLAACCGLLTGCGLFRFAPDDGPAPASAHRVVQSARSQVGKSYVSGGASPRKGFDCSGLVYWAYRVNGYKIPRVTTAQARVGQAVDSSNARAGDIVVFRTGEGRTGLHTGLCTDSKNFIHSPNRRGRVRVERLDVPYWKRKLIAVRRVVR